MSLADVSYSCGSCGYPLNLASSNRITSDIGSKYRKSIRKGSISFESIDLSRFTQLDEASCVPICLNGPGPKTKLLCRQCGIHIGYAYADAHIPHDTESSTIPNSYYKQIVIKIRALQPIDANGVFICSISDNGLNLLAKSCLSLKDLNLEWCSLITDSGVFSSTNNCRVLRAIKINDCHKIKGDGFQGCSRTLTGVEADFCKLEAEGIMGIISGGGLEYLNVSSLTWCVRGDGLKAIGGGLGTSIRILNFRLCRNIADETIMEISKGCPLLKDWNLSLCTEIGLEGWESIGKYCNNLEKLHVNGCWDLVIQGYKL